MNIDYLESGFEPSSLKVAELRRVLTENDVEFASHAKKTELVQLFNDNVKPKIPKLRKKYENLMPSDKDIVKVRSKRKNKGKKKVKGAHSKARESTDENWVRTEESSPQSAVELNVKSESESQQEGEDEQRDGDERETTPFSEINEFQQGGRRKAGSTHKEERSFKKDKEGDIDMSSDKKKAFSEERTPLKEAAELEEKPTKSRKRRRKIGEGENTPITKKVAKKTPQKSPHRSLIIEKFESSSSDSSFNSSPNLNTPSASQDILQREILPERTPENSNLDYSFKRKTISPDLGKLKVSAAFAEQLKNSVMENSTPNYSQSESDYELAGRPRGIRVSRKSASPFRDDEILPALAVDLQRDGSISSQETIKSVDVERHSSVTPEANKLASSTEAAGEEICEEQNNLANRENEALVEKTQDISQKTANSSAAKRGENKIVKLLRFFWSILIKSVIFLIIVTPMLYGLWYRQEKIFIGFCGQEKSLEGSSGDSLLNKVGCYLQDFKPSCVPCPENAICYPFLQIKCRPEYTLKENRWSLYGLLPLGDSCVKDSKREKLISEVVQKSLEFLRTKNAQYLCGECEDDLKSGMTEEELYEIFYESRAPWIGEEEFDELWVQAISDLKNEPEITWRQLSNNRPGSTGNSNSSAEANDIQRKEGHFFEATFREETGIFRSTSKKYISLRCKFEREIYQTYYRFRYILWTLMSLIFMTKLLQRKLKLHHEEKKKINHLTEKVIVRLKEAKRERSDSGSPSFLSTVQLRDVFLSDATDLNHKNKLWNKVVKRLENNNTNIKSTLMEIHGEIMKCWEWIGPLHDTFGPNETNLGINGERVI